MKRKKQFGRARSRLPRTKREYGVMNKSEQAYAHHLEARRIAGEITDWAYEPFTLHLAKATSYQPDFLVQLPDGTMEIHEVKAWSAKRGFLTEDDSWAKMKIAHHLFGGLFAFFRCGLRPKSMGYGWVIEQVGE